MLFVRTLTWVELTETRPCGEGASSLATGIRSDQPRPHQHSSNASTSGWQFPLLYRWWSARQDRTNLEPPAHIAAQALAFQSSLKQLLTTRQAVCSRCGSADTQRINERRPYFRCRGCSSSLSLLRGTLFSRLGYPEHRLTFAQGLINGESVIDLQRRTGLCVQACKRWKVRFLLIFEHPGLRCYKRRRVFLSVRLASLAVSDSRFL